MLRSLHYKGNFPILSSKFWPISLCKRIDLSFEHVELSQHVPLTAFNRKLHMNNNCGILPLRFKNGKDPKLIIAGKNDFGHRFLSSRLAEVGVLESLKHQGKYVTGQLFLHRVFGYRGAILFPWIGKLYDRDQTNAPEKQPLSEDGTVIGNREIKGQPSTYYQVLVDSRDVPHIRVGTEAVTFLNTQENNGTIYSIPGLDYVSHDDILPYNTTEANPIHNHLFEKFLELTDGSYIGNESLVNWQNENKLWLELTDVHRESTNSMRVTVMPFYIGSSQMQQNTVYWWRYCIRLENLGSESIQLRERHWRIFSLSGTLETVRGRGVIGKEPVFSKEQPSFQYTSHVSLQAPSGHMWGTFKMEEANGSHFECRIPPFSLDSKQDASNIPHEFST